jgi:leucyl aminopeptidase
MNRNIHTAKDTIAVSGGNAGHAAKFAKMALGYIVELDR